MLLIHGILLGSFTYFAYKRLLNYLHALQQDDYNSQRMLSWLKKYSIYDTSVSSGLLCLAVLDLVILQTNVLVVLLVLGFLVAAYFELNPLKQAKKSLVLTPRALRILRLAVVISSLYALLFILLLDISVAYMLATIVLVQALPLILVLSNKLLDRQEKKIQAFFYQDAQQHLATCNPTIIGITGSFGKTSLKHILGHILKSSAPTLITPGSVNTVMGITRVIREQLEARHDYFVVEMGAYGPGSIHRLCQLTPPHFGVITAIGHAHFERFKSLETVAKTKFELAQAALAKNGQVIVNADTLEYDASQQIFLNNAPQFVIAGFKTSSQPLNFTINQTQQTTAGLWLQVLWQGQEYNLQTPLFGNHHAENIALAFATALTLGVAIESVVLSLKNLPQVKHRLEKKPGGNGTTILDDAYNSNPIGFRAALNVLQQIDIPGRKILITPGMIELGESHDQEHAAIGEIALAVCDIIAVVQPERIPTFTQAIQNVAPEKLKLFDTFVAAEQWLTKEQQPGDWIVIENDLPDIYERVLKI